MARLNPDFFISEEVAFEIRLRGEEPASTADERRKQLRGLLRSNKAVISASEMNLDMDRDLVWCRDRTLELLSLVEDLGESPDLGSRAVYRLQMCLEHMERRLLFWRQSSDSDGKWADMPLLTKVMEGIVKLSASSVEGDGVLSIPPVVGEVPPASTVSQPSTSAAAVLEISDVTLPGLSSKPSAVSLNLPKSSIPVTSLQQVPVLESSMSVNYNRLPNPLTQLLQQLPVTDGLDVNQLLNILGTLLKISEFPGMKDAGLLQIALPYCRSPLTEMLVSSLDDGVNFDEFHRVVLETFLPGRMKERLCQERFYRLQNDRETLASFIASIKWVARVLRVGPSESAVVGTILEGITPEERSRMVFATRPNSFADLDRLSVTSRMVAYTDELRRQEQRRDWHSSNARIVMQIQEVRGPDSSNRQRKEFVCWECGSKGHTRRFCRQLGRAPHQGSAAPSAQPNSNPTVGLPKNGVAGGERPN